MILFPSLLGCTVVASVRAASFPPGVIATGTQGTTNPPVATMGTIVNQTSMARLLSVNSIDDWCVFAPPSPDTISNTEEIEVAWCTMPRNNARVIPDGTITGLTFLKTDFYVQLMGTGDLTKLNILAGSDGGGELDPHGAQGTGNPIGGNVTTTVADGTDQPIAEWMLYISNNQFCLRACTNANSTYSAAFMCWHELDVMGCDFVMPGTYHDPGTFETCDANVAYPPGWYPTVVDGTSTFSTFAQYFTGVNNGKGYTVGDTSTPAAAASTPSSSNCVTKATISNGIAASLLTAGAIGTAPLPGFTSSAGGSASGGQGTSPGAGSSGSPKSTGSTTGSGSGPGPTGASAASRRAKVVYGHGGEYTSIVAFSLISALAAVALLH